MTFQDIRDLLIQKFGTQVIAAEENSGLQPALYIDPEQLVAVCLELRDNEHTYFDFLSCLSGIDHGAEEIVPAPPRST